MGTRKVEQGEVGHVVAARIRQIRERRQLSLQALSERLDGARPADPAVRSVSKIEQGDRRVDVDDLVAIADALETVPSRLIAGYGDGLDLDFLTRAEELHSEVLRDAVRALRAAEDAGLTRYDVVEWMDSMARLWPILEQLTKSLVSKEMATLREIPTTFRRPPESCDSSTLRAMTWAGSPRRQGHR